MARRARPRCSQTTTESGVAATQSWCRAHLASASLDGRQSARARRPETEAASGEWPMACGTCAPTREGWQRPSHSHARTLYTCCRASLWSSTTTIFGATRSCLRRRLRGRVETATSAPAASDCAAMLRRHAGVRRAGPTSFVGCLASPTHDGTELAAPVDCAVLPDASVRTAALVVPQATDQTSPLALPSLNAPAPAPLPAPVQARVPALTLDAAIGQRQRQLLLPPARWHTILSLMIPEARWAVLMTFT